MFSPGFSQLLPDYCYCHTRTYDYNQSILSMAIKKRNQIWLRLPYRYVGFRVFFVTFFPLRLLFFLLPSNHFLSFCFTSKSQISYLSEKRFPNGMYSIEEEEKFAQIKTGLIMALGLCVNSVKIQERQKKLCGKWGILLGFISEIKTNMLMYMLLC